MDEARYLDALMTRATVGASLEGHDEPVTSTRNSLNINSCELSSVLGKERNIL